MSQTIIEILMDYSGSMGNMTGQPQEGKYLIEGKTRTTIVKQILIRDILPTIEYSSQIFLRTFRYGSELDIKTIYEGNYDKTAIQNAINNLEDPPIGGTPITKAIKFSLDNLKKYPSSDRKIILLTDGDENIKDDNYLSDVPRYLLELTGSPCKIFVIGIAQSPQTEEKFHKLANGYYLNLKSTQFDASNLRTSLAPLKIAVLNSTIESRNLLPKEEGKPEQNPVMDKIEMLKMESRSASLLKLEELGFKLNEQLKNIEKLFNEFSSLKESLRISSFLDPEIDSTTITIDVEYSDKIRLLSESHTYKVLCNRYGPQSVIWLNKEGESYANHDFEILNEDGKLFRIIECKGTPKEKLTFYLTSEEWNLFLANKEIYQVFRVFNVESTMTEYCIENLFQSILENKIVPYLLKPEILKEKRVFLTLIN